MLFKRTLVVILFTVVIGLGLSVYLSETDAGPDENEAVELDVADLDRVVAYIVDQLMKDPGKLMFAAGTVEEATGVTIPDGAGPRIQAAVIARLQETPEGRRILEGGAGMAAAPAGGETACATPTHRCTQYAACSVYGDLAGATGKTLEMYESEKARDGEVFTDHQLPEFEAMDLEGNVVRASDLAGTPTLLVLLAGHCGHSIASIGALQKVALAHEDAGVRVVGVFLNSGPVSKVKSLVDLYDVDYDVWVYPDDTLGDLLESHLVPTYLYVNADGSMKQKLVGQKDVEEIGELVAAYTE